MSIVPPSFSIASGTTVSRCCSSVRSATTISTLVPYLAIRAAVSSRLPGRVACVPSVRATRATSAPSAASRSATPAPIPRLEPVTSARRPSKRLVMLFELRGEAINALRNPCNFVFTQAVTHAECHSSGENRVGFRQSFGRLTELDVVHHRVTSDVAAPHSSCVDTVGLDGFLQVATREGGVLVDHHRVTQRSEEQTSELQ